MRIDQAISYTPARIEAERRKLALLRSHTGTVHLADAGRPEDTFCGQRRDSLEEIGGPESWSGLNGRCQRCATSWNARLEAAGLPKE